MVRSVLGALVVVACLVGCTPTDPVTPAATPAPTASGTPSASPEPEPEPDPESWTPSGSAADPAQFANADGGVAFASPTGDIQCFYSEYPGLEPWWGCVVSEHTVQLPPASADACVSTNADGTPVPPNGIGMKTDADATPTTFCAGTGENPPLAYGASLTYRDMACDSTTVGMICRSLVTGRGFSLSASDYELF